MTATAQPGWIKFQHFIREDTGLAMFESVGGYHPTKASTSYGRRGDYGYRLFSSSDFIEAATEDLTHFTDGFMFSFASATSGVFWEAREGSTVHLQLIRNTDGSVSLYKGISGSGGVLIATTSVGVAPLSSNLFFVIEAEIHDTAGFAILHVDGAGRIDSTVTDPGGIDTKNGGTGVVNRHRWSGSSSPTDSEWHVADIYCADADGAGYHKMHDWRGEHLAANADVIANFTRSTGATNYGTIDELPFSSTDKNTSAVSGDRDRYNHAAGALTHPIVTITVVAQLAKDSGSASAKIGLYSGTNLGQSAAIVLSTTASVQQYITTEEPVSGDPWDATKRDAVNSDIENVT